jgi:hypothetical protein
MSESKINTFNAIIIAAGLVGGISYSINSIISLFFSNKTDELERALLRERELEEKKKDEKKERIIKCLESIDNTLKIYFLNK